MYQYSINDELSISFSGGRTSAYMTFKLLHQWAGNVVVTFANTGCEHEKTLEFVNRCDKELGFNVVWIEADISQDRGVGVRHKVVSYETASRNGEPFEAFIRKYGIPNQTTPQCTTKLKQLPMESYNKSIGRIRRPIPNYLTAIGIRADEADRMAASAGKERLIYPMIGWGTTKEDVHKFWKSMPFDLEIDNEALGNCVWCWKKSFKKLYWLAQTNRWVFDFPSMMESKYLHHKADSAAGRDGERKFFRGFRTTSDLIRESNQSHDEDHLIQQGSCGDSCEVYADSTSE